MVSRTIMGIIGAVIFILIGVALGPTVISSVGAINTTSLMVNYPIDNTTIPLASVIILLGEYLPAFYYLAVVLGGIAAIWASVRYGGD